MFVLDYLHKQVDYSRTSMARTLMAHLPRLARTDIMVPTGLFMHIPPWMAGTTLARTIFHIPKPVRAIEVLLYLTSSFQSICRCYFIIDIHNMDEKQSES